MTDGESTQRPRPSPVERGVVESLEDPSALGRPLSARTRRTRRSIEAYLRAGLLPRYMERLREIEAGIASHRRHVEAAYRALQDRCAGDPELFERRWRARAQAWYFDPLNQLIREHNEWYPIERDLPLDPRTRDYVPVGGRCYRREELGPEWILEQFPAALPPPRAVRRPPRPRAARSARR